MLAGLLFRAFSVALSGILLGMHFFSDVLAGAAIGSAPVMPPRCCSGSA